MEHPSLETLEAGLDEVRLAPKDEGTVELIVCRPGLGERKVLAEAVLDPELGLAGDSWRERPSSQTTDGSPHLQAQLTLMSARAAALLAGDRDRWGLAGDQLYVDLDLSAANFPPGSKLSVGGATIEITAKPHTGCKKFAARFSLDAVRLVASPAGRALNLRGIYARVIVGGSLRPGDAIRKLDR